MHELSIMNNILQIILQYAKRNNAKKIKIVNLKIGQLSDVAPDWAHNYFDMLSKDTIADGAVLNIEKVPITIECNECGMKHTFNKEELDFKCKICGSTDIELIHGRELSVTSIEVD